MAGFIFGGNTGETADSLARKRKIAEALLTPGHTPRNWQEGLTDVAHALSGRIQLSQVEKAEGARRQRANDAVAKALGSYGPFPEAPTSAPGGNPVMAALNGTTAPKPADPNLPSRMDFARAEQAPGGDVYSAFMDTVKAGA